MAISYSLTKCINMLLLESIGRTKEAGGQVSVVVSGGVKGAILSQG